MNETLSVRYEHRIVKEYNGGEYYGQPLIFKVGEFLKKTKNYVKYKYYPVTLGHGVGVSIPEEHVGVFKITRHVCETEERVE